MAKLPQRDKIILFLFFVLLISLSIYSYALVDPNLTLVNNPFWAVFRDRMVYLGYYQRTISWYIYLTIILLLFFLNYYFIKNFKKYNPIKISLLIGLILLLSYPFLSHDFFNYMFDARILTFYHQNPYAKMALDFPKDPWIRFMHWTHRTYPYGPVFLLVSLFPSFFSFGKFAISFLFFKILFIACYVAAVYCLKKDNPREAMLFATHPLVLIEGLVSSHNDLIAVSLALMGIYFLFKEKNMIGRIFFLFSAGIKYLSFPVMLLTKKNKAINIFLFLASVSAIVFASFKMEFQPWYFLGIFCFLPFFSEFIQKCNIFFMGLLLSYYPYIGMDNGWGAQRNLVIKHQIIYVFAGINLLYLLFSYFKKSKL